MLKGHVHIIWKEENTANYTVFMCRKSILPYIRDNSCPKFKAVTNCSVRETKGNMRTRQCIVKEVYQYSEYTFYISGTNLACQIMGNHVKIRTTLSSKYINIICNSPGTS